MDNKKKILLSRTIVFAITVICFAIFLTFDFGWNEIYKFDDNHVPFTYLVYWSHLSNINALVWITIAFVSVLTINNSLENIVNNKVFRNLTFSSIFLTGTIFMIFAFIPMVIQMSTPGEMYLNGYGDYINPSTAYRTMAILGTTFKHLIIPGMFAILFFLGYDRPAYKESKLSNGKTTGVLLLAPIAYWIFVIVLNLCGVQIPYSVLDFVNPSAFIDGWTNLIPNVYVRETLNIIIDFALLIYFGIVSFFLFWWDDKFAKRK